MGGILDIFDDPNLVPALLGGSFGGGFGGAPNSASAAPQPQQPPPQAAAPPQPTMATDQMQDRLASYYTGANGPPQFGGTTGADWALGGPGSGFPDSQAFQRLAIGKDQSRVGSTPTPGLMPASVDATDINLDGDRLALGQPSSASAGPVAPPAPGLTAPPRMPVASAAPPGGFQPPPYMSAPPPAGPAGPPAPAPGPTGGLSSLLQPSTLQVALSGLGRGLSAVGAQRPGATGAASFAAGAGGALTGGEQEIVRQQQMARQAQIDNFNQRSEAFKDMLAGYHTGNETMLDQARAKYFLGQGKGGIPIGSPQYQTAQRIEQLVLRYADQARKTMEAQWKVDALTMAPEDLQKKQEADKQALAKQVDDYRTQRSKAAGVNPDEYKRGLSPDMPFENLSEGQVALLPDQAYYTYHDPSDPKADKNGNVLKQRDWAAQPPPTQPQGQGPSPYEVMMP